MTLRCQWPVGSGAVCGALLEEVHDRRLGKIDFTCPRCARRKAGICVDCPRPVAGQVGKAMRCAEHKTAKARQDTRNWVQRNVAHWRRIARESNRRARDRKRGGPPLPKYQRYRNAGFFRAAALSAERRSEIARIAVTARWARVRAKERAA